MSAITSQIAVITMVLVTGCSAKIKATSSQPKNQASEDSTSAAPAAPAELTFANNSSSRKDFSSDGKIEITWASPDQTVKEYTVHVFKGAGCTGDSLDKTGIKEPKFDFKGESGIAYSFKVSAFGLSPVGSTSNCSSPVTVDLTGPTIPTGLTVSAVAGGDQAVIDDDGVIFLRWGDSTDAESGLASYTVKIFERDTCLGSPIELKDIKETQAQVSASDSITYSYQVMAINNAGLSTNSTCSSAIFVDSIPPSVTDGSINVSGINANGAVIAWAPASDRASAILDYRLCLAPAATALSNTAEVSAYCTGAGWNGAWIPGSTVRSLSGLTPETDYKANLLVRDRAGHLGVYAAATFRTENDATAPLPGAAGVLTTSSISDLTFNLSWTSASDNYLPSTQLDYRVCLSKQDNIRTVSAMMTNCSWQSRWSRDLSTIMIDGLMGVKTYWVNVIVRDRRLNQAAYTALSVTTVAAAVNEYFVDDSLVITTNVGPATLSAGDTVTFAVGEHGVRTGLIFGTNAFSTIATAYAAAAATGGRIILGTGIFPLTVQLAINANIALVGQGATSSVVKINYNTGASGDARGAILAMATRNIVISNLTVDGAGFTVHQAIRSYADPMRVSNSTVNQIRYSTYVGYGIVQIGTSTIGISVINNTMSNIYRIGYNYYANGGISNFKWNHYIGKGAGDGMDHAIVSVGAATSNAIENRAENSLGVASVDGSAGICIWVYNVAGYTQSNMTATRNELVNCANAFWVGFSTEHAITASITKNVITGSTYAIILETTANVDATNNWYGDATGPRDTVRNPNGTGGALFGMNVPITSLTVSPWATDAWIP